MRAVGTIILVSACVSFGFAQAKSQPVSQYRDVFQNRTLIGRGSASDWVEQAGTRHFMSECDVRMKGKVPSYTVVESWLSSEGKPLRATYTATSGLAETRTTFDFYSDHVRYTVESAKGRSGDDVPLKPGELAVMSQFNPFDFYGKDVRNLVIFDPSFPRGLPHRLELIRETDVALVFSLKSSAGWSEIVTDRQGRFLRMQNSSGMSMVVQAPQ